LDCILCTPSCTNTQTHSWTAFCVHHPVPIHKHTYTYTHQKTVNALNNRQDCPKGSSACIVFTHRAIFLYFCPTGATHCTDHAINIKFGREESAFPVKFHLDGLMVWVYGPKTLKIWNFTKGRTPCAILTRIYMVYVRHWPTQICQI